MAVDSPAAAWHHHRVRLDELRTLALRHLAASEYAAALRIHAHILAALPQDLDGRMRVGDICVRLGQLDLARPVYAAVAYLDVQTGRPAHALVALAALRDLGEQVEPLLEAIARLYAVGSPRIGRVGARLSPPAPERELGLPAPPRARAGGELAEALRAAVSRAAETASFRQFPAQLQPLPLLSELTEAALHRVLQAATVHRLTHGAQVVRQGDPGKSFYFVAAGEVRVVRREPGGAAVETELARLYEGALFGEMALIQAEPRSASVEVVGAADLVAFGAGAIRAAADELPALAAALARYTRERLVRNAVAASPLFAPFSPAERLELLGRFTLCELPAGVVHRRGEPVEALLLVVAGELSVVRGEPPFDEVAARVGPGECVGEAELLAEQPATTTLRAERPTLALSLSADYLRRLVLTVPEVRAFLESQASRRLLLIEEPLI